MCQIISHSFDVLAGNPPRRYVLTLRTGDDSEQTIVVENALGQAKIAWRREWGRYQPTAARCIDRAIAELDRRQALSDRRNPEAINAELNAAPRHPTSRPKPKPDSHERQLPAGDRA